MQRAHAISNGVFVGAVNRVGFEHGDVIHNGVTMKGPEGPGLEFWGGSFIADPFGRVIAQASHDKEEILTAEIDLKLLEDTRRNWPFLRDRATAASTPIKASPAVSSTEGDPEMAIGYLRAHNVGCPIFGAALCA